jgi:hypothetical protein
MGIFLVTKIDRFEIEADTIEEARSLWNEYSFDDECDEFVDSSVVFEEDN